MIGERQLQHVLEVAGQNHVPAAMGEAVGIECNQCSAGYGEKTEARPGSKQCH